MKVYISADIEGISGVVNKSHTTPEGHDYARARQLMTDEVNAAIRGARNAGATEILVNDSHGPMTNLCIESLDPFARLITGTHKTYGMMQGLDASFAAALLIGYHGRHNTSGVLAHSYHGGVVSLIEIDGVPVGEFEFNAMLAAAMGVPVVLVSGDDVLAGQVKAYDEAIETVTVKVAVNRYSANCLHPQRVHELLEAGVQKALAKHLRSGFEKPLAKPVILELSFMHSGMAEACLGIPEIQAIKPNAVRYEAKSIREAYTMRSVLTTLAASTL